MSNLTYTPQPDNWKPIRSTGPGEPPVPATIPTTITLRECYVWRHTEGDDLYYRFFCYETVPPAQYVCVYAHIHKQHFLVQVTSSDFANKALMQAFRDGLRLHPTLDEAIAAYDLTDAPRY